MNGLLPFKGFVKKKAKLVQAYKVQTSQSLLLKVTDNGFGLSGL